MNENMINLKMSNAINNLKKALVIFLCEHELIFGKGLEYIELKNIHPEYGLDAKITFEYVDCWEKEEIAE